jgi:hypothetical protein
MNSASSTTNVIAASSTFMFIGIIFGYFCYSKLNAGKASRDPAAGYETMLASLGIGLIISIIAIATTYILSVAL